MLNRYPLLRNQNVMGWTWKQYTFSLPPPPPPHPPWRSIINDLIFLSCESSEFLFPEKISLLFFFLKKNRHDILCESSARQTIHIIYWVLFNLWKKKKKKLLRAVCCGCDWPSKMLTLSTLYTGTDTYANSIDLDKTAHNELPRRQFAWNVKAYFLGKNRKIFQNVICLKFYPGSLELLIRHQSLWVILCTLPKRGRKGTEDKKREL